MAPTRRALIAITSATAKIWGGKEDTGLFSIEALHPYNVLRAAGFEVDLASETGKYTVDGFSLGEQFLSGEDLKTWNDPSSEFRRKLDNMVPASQLLEKNDYNLFFASAGHGALIDYPTAKSLQQIASNVWGSGGVVASVCHGPAIFAGVVDPATGEHIIKGKEITGFTTEAEDVMDWMVDIKSWGSELVEDVAKRLGAKCEFCLLTKQMRMAMLIMTLL
jgi:D-lactate dehydratase